MNLSKLEDYLNYYSVRLRLWLQKLEFYENLVLFSLLVLTGLLLLVIRCLTGQWQWPHPPTN